MIISSNFLDQDSPYYCRSVWYHLVNRCMECLDHSRLYFCSLE